MKVAVVGATGLVGSTIIQILKEKHFPVTEFLPVASEKSKGKLVSFDGKDYPVITLEEALAQKPHLALFSAGGTLSLEWAERFAATGCVVIDNSSAWRMDLTKKLVVPEVNGGVLTKDDKIIANPNCSTIQMVAVLKPLHDRYRIKRIVVSTYQSVTGSGQKGVDQLLAERSGDKSKAYYPHQIDLNLIPQIDVFMENGYSKEEMKMIWETKKILNDNAIAVTATTVRVPVMGGHSESVNIAFHNDFNIAEVKALLAAAPGVALQDDPAQNVYPMPLTACGKDAVFVGRLRRDESQENSLNCWIVADNLRKGAATNAVQIAEYLIQHQLIEN